MDADLALWRWSTALQFVSALTIAVFFLVFARDVRSTEVRSWSRAWLANLGAIFITDIYWFLRPADAEAALLRGGYAASKTLFVLLIAEGIWVVRHRTAPPRRLRTWVALAAAVGLMTALMIPTIPLLGVVQHALVAVVCAVAALIAFRDTRDHAVWFGVGVTLRGALAVAACVAYASVTEPVLLRLSWSPELVSQFLAMSSALDTGAEWLLALGCVLVATTRTRADLEVANRELTSAQATLRAMVDRDPLTGLANRRVLPAMLRQVQPEGASVVFLDLRGFKAINDSLGHQVGDEALRAFADELRQSFRPEDQVVRYAGDEFVVVAQGLGREATEQRIEALRRRLSLRVTGPAIAFDAGHAQLDAHGHPDEALRAADDAMYAAKQRAHARGRERIAS
ncbi:MAG: GGDEF domain-containing protein [Gemmatimonadaceae bacterium]|jgi:diguanylate cyclase (GGDEF)-like protein|nr:GGDEF domain-containing protein [Gemmatimonadaceae bacterium]